jgi:hypothetical protein
MVIHRFALMVFSTNLSAFIRFAEYVFVGTVFCPSYSQHPSPTPHFKAFEYLLFR